MLWIAATSLLLNMADMVRLVAETVQLIGLVLAETFLAWLCMTFCWDDLRWGLLSGALKAVRWLTYI